MAKKKFLFDWTKFYAKHLSTATVENAAAANVVLTFLPAGAVKAFHHSLANQFTIVGKTVDLLTVNYTTGTVTIRVTVGFVAGAAFDLTHNPLLKGDTVVTSVHNHVV